MLLGVLLPPEGLAHVDPCALASLRITGITGVTGWVGLLGSLALAQSAAAAPRFVPLGDLPGRAFESRAYDVSADGSTAVGHAVSATGSEAFRWTRDEGMVGLGDLPGGPYESWATGVSADGATLVGVGRSASGYQAFRWTREEGLVGLGDPPGVDFENIETLAYGVSADGSTVVGYYSYFEEGPEGEAFGDEAIRWARDDGIVPLGGLSDEFISSQASAVSAEGSTVVGEAVSDFGNYEAFRWTADEGMEALGDLPGGSIASRAHDISADGSTVVGIGRSASGYEAFRWTRDEGMVGLGDLPGGSFDSWAHGVSGDGSIVVGASDAESGPKAFLWDEARGMQALDEVLTALGLGPQIAGWELRAATGISDDGKVVVGSGINPDGQTEAWLVRLPEPESGPALLLSSGLLLGLAGRRRRSS